MVVDKNGWFILAEVIGNERQITATIKLKYWRVFKVGTRVKIYNTNNKEIYVTRKVNQIGKGKQRQVIISQSDRDLFQIGDKIKIYPLKDTEQKKNGE